MIKAEDLRIGDLVRVSRDCAFPKGTVCIITDIHAEKTFKDKKEVVDISSVNDTDDGPWGTWCCNIEGMPITPEILEKNGWGTKMFGGSKFFCIELNCYLELCVTYEKKDNNFSVGTFSHIPGGDLDINYFPIDIQYVHELQHILWALRLKAEFKI
jgi:hypothetical protein